MLQIVHRERVLKVFCENNTLLLKSPYKLHYRTKFQGIPISIENRKGSIRRWYDPNEKRWGETKFHYPYGYIRLTQGEDGDHIDCFLGDDRESPHVFIVRQVNPVTKLYDEDKVMLGFNTMKEAVRAYQKHYDKPDFLGDVDYMTIDEFKDYLATRRSGAILVKSKRKGLVPKKVLVTKDGKQFWAIRWVKPGNDEHAEEGIENNLLKESGKKRLALNGKPSNLSPKQWHTVRTAQFREWFGDYEKLYRIQKIRESKPIRIDMDLPGPLSELRKKVSQFALSNLRGSYVNKDTGNVIWVTRDSIKESVRHSEDKNHYALATHLDKLIINSIYLDWRRNEKARKDVKYYEYYIVGAMVNGEDYTVKLAIAVTNTDKNKRFYDFAESKIEKGNLFGVPGLTDPFSTKTVAQLKDKRLLEISQVDSSRVVDENGEPLVVFHGTNKKFNIFSKSNDIGFHFGTKEAAKRAKKSTKKEGEWYIGAFFLNIRNPLEVPDLGNWSLIDLVPVLQEKEVIPQDVSWFDIDDEARKRARKQYKELSDLIMEGNGERSNEEWDSLLEKWGEVLQEKRREIIVEYLKKAGYDGLKYRNTYEGGYSWIALEPTQIKSATDNSGAFDTENPDFTKSIKLQWFDLKNCKVKTRYGTNEGIILCKKEKRRDISMKYVISVLFKSKTRLPEKPDKDEPLPVGAHRTPPKGYPEERSKYASPNEYKYPLDTEEHVRAAISYFSMPKNYSKYDPAERKAIWSRIVRAAKKFGIEVQEKDKF